MNEEYIHSFVHEKPKSKYHVEDLDVEEGRIILKSVLNRVGRL
jgi:hypothetical protein